MFAEIAVNVPNLPHAFHYAVPENLQDKLVVGQLVTVPFGTKRAQGIVLGLTDESPVSNPKPIEGLIDPTPVLSRAQLDLAFWLAHTYLAPLSECLTLMLPPGLTKQADALYTLLNSQAEVKHPTQQAVLNLLKKRSALRGAQIDRALPRQNWRGAMNALMQRGLVTSESYLALPSVRAKHARTARLSATLEQVEAAKPQLSRSPAKAQRLTAVLDFLANDFDPVEVAWVYAETGASLQDLKDLAALNLVELGEAEVWRNSLADKTFVPVEPPELTADQPRVWETLRQQISAPLAPGAPRDNVFLVHGVTGSGKTEIYLRALGETLAQGRRALVLVPEIALTPQTIRRFAARFPRQLAVWHSQLSDGERYDTWRRTRAGLIDLIIGPRSALFLPLPKVGLIILDEEHDEAYKQSPPQTVLYHTREAAVEYARQTGAICLLGSATPDLVSYYRAKQGEYRLLELPRRIMGHTRALQEQAAKYHVASHYHVLADGPREAQTIDLPRVEVVDLRQELRANNLSIFSRRLQTALLETLARDEQAILFLNRRGSSTYVFCRGCGEALLCPQCETPLTYHGPAGVVALTTAADTLLICHHCNHRRQPPERCPQCGDKRIKYFGVGTEKVEETVRAQFPQARPVRWDQDMTRARGAHDLILQQFISHQANVMIGTQMIAKGLDLPLVTLVGVISADVGLGLPDYRAAERTFQILTQVAGRAGRSLLGGRVILQTYHPDHYVIQAASKHDYDQFFTREMRYRKELGYPPFRRLMRLIYQHPQPERAETEANILAQQLRARLREAKLPATDLAGPAPCFFQKIAGEYRWQIVVRGPDPAQVLRGLTLKGWTIDVDPMSTL